MTQYRKIGMKQEPILPNKDISNIVNLPKKMDVCSTPKRSYYIFSVIFAFLGHLACFVIVVLCFQIPEQIIPLSSDIEVQFQENPESIPEDVTPLSNDMQETSHIETPEAFVTSDNLPDTDQLLPIIVAKPVQKPIRLAKTEPKILKQENNKSITNNSQTSQNNFAKANDSQAQATVVQNQGLNKARFLSVEQRCTAPVKKYPLAARKRHEQGKVIVRLQLLPNGQITHVSVEESSGFSDLDQAAIQAVQGTKCQATSDQSVLDTTTLVNFTLHPE